MDAERDTWGFAEGEAITPDLTALRRLGGGRAYDAYVAFDEITYCPVVVKLVRPGRTEDAATLAGLRREIDALAAVNHPVVVRALRHDLDGGRPHVVLEHIDGPRLSTLLRRHGPLTEQQYLPLAIDIAAALHYLRRVGYVHLDIKPSNIVMGAPARLIDLSIARPVAAARELTHPVGTDRYLSPEQAEPQAAGRPDHASDVWGLGATLYEAVTGDRPFPEGERAAEDPVRRYPQLTHEPASLDGRIPPEVAEVIAGCLERDPARRPLPARTADLLQPVLERQPRARLTSKLRR